MNKIIDFAKAKEKLLQKKRDEEIKKFNRDVNFIVQLIEQNMSEEEKRRREQLEEELEKALQELVSETKEKGV